VETEVHPFVLNSVRLFRCDVRLRSRYAGSQVERQTKKTKKIQKS